MAKTTFYWLSILALMIGVILFLISWVLHFGQSDLVLYIMVGIIIITTGLFSFAWRIKLEKRKKIIFVAAVGIICILLLSIFVVPYIGYYRVIVGMKENDVKNILGEPKYDGLGNSSMPGFGPHPVLPENMTFRSWNYIIENYFMDDQIVIIFLVSAGDYSKLTGQKIDNDCWRVVEKYMYSMSIVY